jgi:hypothetical protein
VTGAIALAIVLVVAVIGVSMAMETQRSAQPTSPRPPRPSPPGPSRRQRERSKERKAPEAETASATSDAPSNAPFDSEPKGPELLRNGQAADAKVLSVVDERTIGPVTRSRLDLHITPGEGAPFEVTVRMAFSTPEARAQVKVGSTIPVRFDPSDRSRVVVDLPQP